jgi:hypothetical protein
VPIVPAGTGEAPGHVTREWCRRSVASNNRAIRDVDRWEGGRRRLP